MILVGRGENQKKSNFEKEEGCKEKTMGGQGGMFDWDKGGVGVRNRRSSYSNITAHFMQRKKGKRGIMVRGYF